MKRGVICVVIKKNCKMNKCRQRAHPRLKRRGRKKGTPFISSQVIVHLQYRKLISCISYPHPLFCFFPTSSSTISSKSECGLQKIQKLYIFVSIEHFFIPCNRHRTQLHRVQSLAWSCLWNSFIRFRFHASLNFVAIILDLSIGFAYFMYSSKVER